MRQNMRSEAEIAAVRDFVRSLNALVKSARLYGAEHDRVSSQIDISWAKLQTSLSDTPSFVLGASGAVLMLENIPLGDSPVERGFAEMLSKGGVNSIQFASHITHEEFSLFIKTLAGGGPKQQGAIIARLQEALGNSPHAGIQVNDIRPPGEASAAAAAPPEPERIDVELLLQALSEPKKLLEALAPAIAEIPPEGEIPSLHENEVASLMKLVTLLRESESTPDKANQVQKHITSLPIGAQAALHISLSDLAENPSEEHSDQPMLTQLGAKLILRYAQEAFGRGEVETNDLGDLFIRLSRDIPQPESSDVPSFTDTLKSSFWDDATDDKITDTLNSPEAWCVPLPGIKRVANGLMEAGDAMDACNILLNYASCVGSPDVDIRRKVAQGLRDLANLYASTFSEVLDGAFEHISNQLSKEDIPELKKLLTDAFLQINTAATAIIKPTPGSVNLECMTCKEEQISLVATGPRADPEKTYEMTFYCLRCSDATLWSGTQADRRDREEAGAEGADDKRSGEEDRRNIRRVRMKLSIRVRSEAPGQDFTVVGDTVNISRTGVLFECQRMMVVGLHVMVLMPYEPGEDLPESKARVVRCDQQQDENYYIALHFER